MADTTGTEGDGDAVDGWGARPTGADLYIPARGSGVSLPRRAARAGCGGCASVARNRGRENPGVNKGALESRLTMVSPYLRLHLNERVSVRDLAG